MRNPDWQCAHFNLWYEDGTLVCSDCKKRGLESYLENHDYPATFKEIFTDPDTGFSITKINNHVDKVTFFRSFNAKGECLGEFMNLHEALSIGTPSLIKLN